MLALAYTLENRKFLADQISCALLRGNDAKIPQLSAWPSATDTQDRKTGPPPICEIPADQICALARRMAAVRTHDQQPNLVAPKRGIKVEQTLSG